MASVPTEILRWAGRVHESTRAVSIAREGLSVLSDGSEKLIDIVLVHGLNGHPERTWTNSANDFFWPDVLARQVPEARVMVFGYDAGISSAFASSYTRVKAVASDLLNELRNVRQEVDEVRRPLLMLGHSLGGLVIKHALLRASRTPGNDREHIYRATKAVMFFATPNTASHISQETRRQIFIKIGKVAFTQLPSRVEQALETHSDELDDLTDDFRSMDMCHTRNLQIYSFYEENITDTVGDTVVDEFSARTGVSHEEVIPVNADHEEIVKFIGENDKIFRTIITTAKSLTRYKQDSIQTSLTSNFASLMLSDNLPMAGTIAGTIAVTQKARETQYYQIPKERKVSKFIGRKRILDDISKTFSPIYSGEQIQPISLALIGMGGIGKTQIVLEYCQRSHYLAKHFASVFWINAHSREGLTNSLVKIADDLRTQAVDVYSAEQKVNFVLETWSNWHSPYLVVYDNFDDPDFQDIQAFIPAYGPGALLFTSRIRGTVRHVDHTIDVTVMDEDEAIDLLSTRSGLQTTANDTSQQTDAKEVVRALECLPLALDQAGAYIKESSSNVTFKIFLDHFEQKKKKVLEQVPTFWQYRDYANESEKQRYLSVITTWELSLKALPARGDGHESKVRFLTLASFLGGHRTSKVLFKTHLQCLNVADSVQDAVSILNSWSTIFRNQEEFDDDLYRKTIVDLNELSLIRGFVETDLGDIHFSIHSLVQDWAKLRLTSTDEQQSYLREAMNIMQSVFEKHQNKFGGFLEIGRLVGLNSSLTSNKDLIEAQCGDMMIEIVEHVQACIKQAGLTGPELDGSLPVEPYFASFLIKFDMFSAGGIWRRILRYAISHFGGSDERTLEIMRAMITVRAYAAAPDEMSQIMDELDNAYGPTHPDIWLAMSALIEMLSIFPNPTGDQRELLSGLVTELKASLEQIPLDYRNSSVKIALKLGLGLIILGELDSAESLLDRCVAALPIELDGIAPSPELQLARLVRIRLYKDQGRVIDVEAAARQSLAGLEQQKAEHDIELALTVRCFLAESYANQGKWNEAATTAEIALEQNIRTLGPYEATSQILGIMIAGYRISENSENLEVSKENIGNILKSQRELLGENSLKTLMIEMIAAEIYKIAGQYRLSFELFRFAYLAHRQWLSYEDKSLIQLEDKYATTLTKVTDKTESEIAEVLGMFNDRILVNHIESERENPTKLKLGKFWQALRCYDKVLELYDVEIGVQKEIGHEIISYNEYNKWQNLVAACYRSLRRFDESMVLYSGIVEYLRYHGGINNQNTGVLLDYGHVCHEAGRLKDAENSYQEVLDLRIRSFGPEHEKTIRIREFLSQTFKKAKSFAAAAEQFRIILLAKRSFYGAEDKKIIGNIFQLAEMLYLQETNSAAIEAEACYREALELKIRYEGLDSKGVSGTRRLLALTLVKINKYTEAATLYLEVANWREKHDGPEAQSTIDVLFELSITYMNTGELAKAKDALVRVVNWRKSKYGLQEFATLTAIHQLGNSYLGLGQVPEALPHLIEAANGHVALDPWPPMTVSILNQLALTGRVLKDWPVVEKSRLRIVEFMERATNPPTPPTAILENKAAAAVAKVLQGKAADTEAVLADLLEFNVQLNPASLSTALACYWNAESQRLLENEDSAAEFYARFISYDGPMFASPAEETQFSWGLGWATMCQRANEQLEIYYSKNIDDDDSKAENVEI